MPDQAHDLRRLMINCVRPGAAPATAQPRWFVVAGGKGGVGTTTVALHLALADARRRTLLVDADPRGGDIALRCGIEDRYSLCDLVSGHRTLAEVVHVAKGGVPIVPGACAWDDFGGGSSAVLERFREAVEHDNLNLDTAVIDVGNSPSRETCRLCQAADAVVMVTSAETAGIIGIYNAIKRLASSSVVPPMFLAVNMAPTPSIAQSVYRRLARAGRRFLGVRLETAGHFPVVQPSRLQRTILCGMDVPGTVVRNQARKLNFRVSSADNPRAPSVREVLSNWTKQVEFGGLQEAKL